MRIGPFIIRIIRIFDFNFWIEFFYCFFVNPFTSLQTKIFQISTVAGYFLDSFITNRAITKLKMFKFWAWASNFSDTSINYELRLRCCSFGKNLAISIIGILEKPSRMRVRISGHERRIALINASEIFKPSNLRYTIFEQ